jgi:hypothetical protein
MAGILPPRRCNSKLPLPRNVFPLSADPQWLVPADLAVPAQKLALRHWLSLRGEGQDMPVADEVDLLDWPAEALPRLTLVRGRPGEDRLQLEFIGNVAAMFSGATHGGRYMDEFYPLEQMALVNGFFALPAKARGPVLVRDLLTFPPDGASMMQVERLSMPLQSVKGEVDLFVTLHYFKPVGDVPLRRMRLVGAGTRLRSRQVWHLAL